MVPTEDVRGEFAWPLLKRKKRRGLSPLLEWLDLSLLQDLEGERRLGPPGAAEEACA